MRASVGQRLIDRTIGWPLDGIHLFFPVPTAVVARRSFTTPTGLRLGSFVGLRHIGCFDGQKLCQHDGDERVFAVAHARTDVLRHSIW